MDIKRFFVSGWALFTLPLLIGLAWAGPPNGEIEVSLFGNPCRMSGPFGADTLRRIHSISPERIPPALSFKQLEETLAQLNEIHKGDVPPAFEPYLEKSRKRLKALAAFYDGLDAAKKSKSAADFVAKISDYVPTGAQTDLTPTVDKLSKDWTNVTLRDQLLDLYQRKIEPDPEADFHRATKRVRIRYTCNLEETD